MPDFFTQSSVYGIVIIFGFAQPCVLVIVVTSCVVRFKLVRSSRRRDLMTSPNGTTIRDGGRSSANQELRTDKLARMVRTMTVSLLLTWVPFFIVGSTKISGQNSVFIPQPLLFSAFWLLVSNGFLNTLIYFVMNSAFREACHKIVKSLIPEACLRLNKLEARLCTKCCASWATERPLSTAGNANTTMSGSVADVRSTESVELRTVTITPRHEEHLKEEPNRHS